MHKTIFPKSLFLIVIIMLLSVETVPARAGGGKSRRSSSSSSRSSSSSSSRRSSSTRRTSSTRSTPRVPVFRYRRIVAPVALGVLAHQYYISADSLKKLNPSLNNHILTDTVRADSLKLPDVTARNAYLVKSGDTWESVAAQKKVKVEELKFENVAFVFDEPLKEGQTIFIPTKGVNPFIVILIIIIIAVVILKVIKSLDKSIDSGNISFSSDEGETAAPVVSRNPELSSLIAALQERDPAFSTQSFEDFVSTAFFKIQRAWCKRDMSLARAFITDSILRRYTLQLEEYVDAKKFNKLEGLNTKNVEVIDLRDEGDKDIIDVLITASAADYDVDEEGNYLSGDRSIITWDETWSFIRSKSVQTQSDKGFNSDTCPSCGAPLSINAVGVCDYCGSTVTKGEFDWVLSEITQLN